jgi:hypothetical protein
VPRAAKSKGAGDGGRDIVGKHKVVVVRAQEAVKRVQEAVKVTLIKYKEEPTGCI